MLNDELTIIDVTKKDENLDLFGHLVAAEIRRRRRQRQESQSLEDLEKTYFGPEVGNIRRCFNQVLMSKINRRGDLLDYGCGGWWWKDEYWPGYDSVTAAEVDRSALEEIGENYPQVIRWHTENGVIASARKFDVILSSSVVGYILPVQAEHHIATCADLLKDNGQLVVTRVLAFNFWAFLRSKKLVDIGGGTSFAYHYSKRELKSLLKRHGFQKLEYIFLGGRVPGVSWKFNQLFYRLAPTFMTRVFPLLFPFLKIHHMVIAYK